MDEKNLCVKKVPIFNHLDKNNLEKIMDKVSHINLKKGQYLYMAGDKINSLYIVSEGAIKITRIISSGKENLVKILKEGDFTGDNAIFSNDNYLDEYAYCLTDTRICKIEKEDFIKLLNENPSIALSLINQLNERLNEANKQITRISMEYVEKRLALYLSDLLKKTNDDKNLVKLPLSRKDLASFLGTSPETLSRKFKDLQKMGLIEQLSIRDIKILDIDKLSKLR